MTYKRWEFAFSFSTPVPSFSIPFHIFHRISFLNLVFNFYFFSTLLLPKFYLACRHWRRFVCLTISFCTHFLLTLSVFCHYRSMMARTRYSKLGMVSIDLSLLAAG